MAYVIQQTLLDRLEQGIGYYAEKVVNNLKNGADSASDDQFFMTLSLWYNTLIYPGNLTADEVTQLYFQVQQVVGDFPGNEVITEDIVLP